MLTCKCGYEQEVSSLSPETTACRDCGRVGCWASESPPIGINSIIEPPIRVESMTEPSLKEVQNFVGGYVEIVYSGDMQILVNEEGSMLGLPENSVASILAGRHIVGPAWVLTGKAKWG